MARSHKLDDMFLPPKRSPYHPFQTEADVFPKSGQGMSVLIFVPRRTTLVKILKEAIALVTAKSLANTPIDPTLDRITLEFIRPAKMVAKRKKR